MKVTPRFLLTTLLFTSPAHSALLFGNGRRTRTSRLFGNRRLYQLASLRFSPSRFARLSAATPTDQNYDSFRLRQRAKAAPPASKAAAAHVPGSGTAAEAAVTFM